MAPKLSDAPIGDAVPLYLGYAYPVYPKSRFCKRRIFSGFTSSSAAQLLEGLRKQAL